MSGQPAKLRFFLDAGVPDSVARVLRAAGHEVFLHRDVLPQGSPDQLVCVAAEINECILVASDGDMKQMARGFGIGTRRFKTLSLVKLSCHEPTAAERVSQALSLILHEWEVGANHAGRRLFVEIQDGHIRTNR